MSFLRANLETILIIALGAVLGANLRYFINVWAVQRWGVLFPWGTLIVNAAGSFMIGFFLTLISTRMTVDPRWRIFFATGFLGSFTTFSAFTYESIALVQEGNWAAGAANLLGGGLLGLVATLAGIWLGRLV